MHEDQCPFFIVSHSVLLRMRNVSDKSPRENYNKCFIFGNYVFEYRTVCEIMWKYIVQLDRPQVTIWRMRIIGARTRLIVTLYIHCLSCDL